MKHLPKVKFVLPTIERDAKVLSWFCSPRPTGWDWSDMVYKRHPELRKKLKGVKSNKKTQEACHEYVKKFRRENTKEFKKVLKKFQKEWDKYNNKYLQILSNHFETEIPVTRKIIKVHVSVNPICPRFLDDWSFNVYWKAKIEFSKEIVAHELLHFVYFKKWMEVFPKTKRKELESPFLVWKLSEIMAPIILKQNPEIQRMLRLDPIGYREFKRVRLGKKRLNTHFFDLYKKHLKTKNSFEDFLKICWREINKYKKIINNI